MVRPKRLPWSSEEKRATRARTAPPSDWMMPSDRGQARVVKRVRILARLGEVAAGGMWAEARIRDLGGG
jgi:hypothetical protein